MTKKAEKDAKNDKRSKRDKEAIPDLHPSAKADKVRGGTVRKAGSDQLE